MTALERIRDAIGVDNCKPNSNGGYECNCPAHPDKRASLSVNPNNTGDGVVLTCHARCSHLEVLAALKMEEKDLYDNNARKNKAENRSATCRSVFLKAGGPLQPAGKSSFYQTFFGQFCFWKVNWDKSRFKNF